MSAASATSAPVIEAVFFDLGKVLVHFDWTRSLAEISRRSPHTPAQALHIINSDGVHREYEHGRITCEAFFQTQAERLQYQGTPDELRRLWCDIFTPLHGHIALAQQLARTHIVGIISNTNAAHIEFLEPIYPLFQIFEPRRRIYSHHVNAMKPDREIYDIAIATAGTRPERTLFIDDLEPNVAGARAIGWHAIHLRPDTDLAAELERFGLGPFERAESGAAHEAAEGAAK
ncbi:hypothetical protein DB346_01770 [Verrucomicrobia bacterium LW23]|nr:hypothetical protein DB346_01770 [Verrucomicrobia bacterium LW23]